MLNTQLVEKYAAAIFEVAQEEGKLVEYDDELMQIRQLFEDNRDLKLFMADPQIGTAAKKKLMRQLFEKNALPAICNFLLLLIDKHRIHLLAEIIERFHFLSNATQNIELVYVRSAKELTPKQQDKLLARLEELSSKKISLKIRTDADLIGGLVIKIGDRLIDGSVVGQLNSIKKQLMANC